MTVDTVFWIASMTKAITSTAAMQLVERGKLALDAPISEVLPELGVAAGARRLRCRGRAQAAPGQARRSRCATCSPTRRASATTSGIPTSARYMEKTGMPGIISCENAALTTPLTFDPGERWDYGINIDWVGKAVEASSGKKLGDYFDEQPVRPARHGRTPASCSAPRQRARLVGMHARGRRRRAGADAVRDPAGAGVLDGRRRALRHRGRLPRVRAACC